MFAPELYAGHGLGHYAGAWDYPETAVLTHEMPLHTTMSDHHADYFHPLTYSLLLTCLYSLTYLFVHCDSLAHCDI